MPGRAGACARAAYRGLRMLKSLGLNRLAPPVVVLAYHRVTELAVDPQLLAVAPDNFREQLRYLQEHYPLVRFEDEWSGITAPSVAVTFDDGYADNAREALPILEEVGVPATFFVSSGSVGSLQEFWWDELERVLLGERDYPESFTLSDPRQGGSWPTGSPARRAALYARLHRMLREAAPQLREQWLAQLRGWARLDPGGREQNRPLSLAELQRLAASRWATIGAHGVSHTPLSSLSKEKQREEILCSKRQLEGMVGSPVQVFSYPYGRKRDYDAASVRICREAGFLKSAANFRGQARRWSDPYQLPRQLVRNWDRAEFGARMKEFWLL